MLQYSLETTIKQESPNNYKTSPGNINSFKKHKNPEVYRVVFLYTFLGFSPLERCITLALFKILCCKCTS